MISAPELGDWTVENACEVWEALNLQWNAAVDAISAAAMALVPPVQPALLHVCWPEDHKRPTKIEILDLGLDVANKNNRELTTSSDFVIGTSLKRADVTTLAVRDSPALNCPASQQQYPVLGRLRVLEKSAASAVSTVRIWKPTRSRLQKWSKLNLLSYHLAPKKDVQESRA